MSDQDNGAEAINSDETQLDTLRESIDDPMVLKAQLAKEAEARRQLTARAKNAEAELKEAKEALIRKDEGKDSSITNQTSTPVEDERLELRFQGYSKEQVNFIMANGGTKSLEDKNSMTAIAINAQREQLKAEQAAAQTKTGGEDQFREVNFNLPKDPSLKDLKSSLEMMEKALPHAD